MTIYETLDSLENTYGYQVRQFCRKNKWQYASGATKGVFIIPNRSYVLKFSFDDDYDEARVETEIYNDAVLCGVERIFPKTCVFYTNKHGITFYSQERITSSIGDCGPLPVTSTAKARENAQKVAHEMYYVPASKMWMHKAYQVYGKRFMGKLADFTKKHCINDLHNGNIGYINNRPIILDFAGYHQGSDEYCESYNESY